MPRGSKEKYTDKQKRQAEHIEDGYRGARGAGRRGGAASLGDRQRDDRRRQEAGWLRPRQEGEYGAGQEGRPPGRGGGEEAFGCRAVGLGEEGGSDSGSQQAGPIGRRQERGETARKMNWPAVKLAAESDLGTINRPRLVQLDCKPTRVKAQFWHVRKAFQAADCPARKMH